MGVYFELPGDDRESKVLACVEEQKRDPEDVFIGI